MRVALLTNIVPPYRVPVYRALADTPGWELRILTNAHREFDRSWDVDATGLDVELVRGVSRVWGERTVHVPLGLSGALRRFAPEVVVSAELGPRSFAAWAWCAPRRVPLVVWSYSTAARTAGAGRLRSALARFLLGRADAVVGMGVEARRLLRERGVPAARIFDAPNAHDVETWQKALASLDRDAVRRDLHAGLGTRASVALVVGRLFPIKGVVPLLEAWDRLESGLRRDWTLLFVGSGPLAEAVVRARETHLPGEIVHVPAVQPEAVTEFHAAADLLVFPSLGDVWGLAVNEAMHSGLPVLCSTRAGCAPDLLRPGENGWLADPLDPEGFAGALREALRCGQRHRMGECAARSAASFTPERMAEGLRRAVAGSRRATRDARG